jgi:branched-chain amino acid transport system substrate-binding protein
LLHRQHMQRSASRVRTTAAVVALVLLAAACGSDSDASSTTTRSTTAPAGASDTTTGDTTGSSASTEASPSTEASSSSEASPTTGSTDETTASSASSSDDAPLSADDLVKADGDVRGFDGTTVKVASLGQKSQLPTLDIGIEARFKRFNDTNEIPGIQLDYLEYADDNGDQATALSEARRLVSSEKVFSIVGDASSFDPVDYFAEEKVPYVGNGLSSVYCTEKPSTELWGFSVTGCLLPNNPPVAADKLFPLYKYVSEKTGKTNPTLAIFTSETEAAVSGAKAYAAAAEGNGFDVVMSDGILAFPGPISDYTPYVQQLLTSNGGDAPDAMTCLAAVDCIAIWGQLQATGYAGVYQHFLYSDQLLVPMKGSVVVVNAVPFNAGTPAVDQMIADITEVKPDQAVDVPTANGYYSADMFIQALKEIAAVGTDYITPENLRTALSTMTWTADGLAGPLKYPDSTVATSPSCSALLEGDGTAWNIVEPYACSDKTFPIG